MGFQLALRTGYSLPFGKVASEPERTLASESGGQVPLTLDLTYRLSRRISAGVYVGVSFGSDGQRQEPEIGSRFGVEGFFHLAPASTLNPWLGYGIGWETLSRSAVNDDVGGGFKVSGLEFAHFISGFDFRPNDFFGFGPFVDLSVGQYDSPPRMSTTNAAVSGSRQPSPAEALHEWLTIGAKFTLWP